MSEDYKKDFSGGDLGFMPISLISVKTRVLILGGGRAGSLKAKAFLSHGCLVTVISMDFADAFEELQAPNLCLIRGAYDREFIKKAHLVVIAVSDEALAIQIKEDCEAEYKLYLHAGSASQGLFIIPAVGETREGIFTFHTKKGSPATAKLIRTKIKEQLSQYDAFIEFACNLRASLAGNENQPEIMRFVNTEEFLEYYRQQKHLLILKLFYGGMDFEA